MFKIALLVICLFLGCTDGELLPCAAIAEEILDEKTAGNLSTLFDVGGVVGGIFCTCPFVDLRR